MSDDRLSNGTWSACPDAQPSNFEGDIRAMDESFILYHRYPDNTRDSFFDYVVYK